MPLIQRKYCVFVVKNFFADKQAANDQSEYENSGQPMQDDGYLRVVLPVLSPVLLYVL